jgi:hypothetical protein
VCKDEQAHTTSGLAESVTAVRENHLRAKAHIARPSAPGFRSDDNDSMSRRRHLRRQDNAVAVATRPSALLRLLSVFPQCDPGYLAQCVAAHENGQRNDDDIVSRVSHKMTELNYGEYPHMSSRRIRPELGQQSAQVLGQRGTARSIESRSSDSERERDELETLTRNKAL